MNKEIPPPLDQVIRIYLVEMMRQTQSAAKAAFFAGVSRSSIFRWIKQYKILESEWKN